MIASITIDKSREYVPAQQNLIKLWEEFVEKAGRGMTVFEIGLIITYPRSRSGYRQRLQGIKVQSIGLTAKGEREILRIMPDDFLTLMAKSGIKIIVEEVPDGGQIEPPGGPTAATTTPGAAFPKENEPRIYN